MNYILTVFFYLYCNGNLIAISDVVKLRLTTWAGQTALDSCHLDHGIVAVVVCIPDSGVQTIVVLN
jgi:hypothetical protein